MQFRLSHIFVLVTFAAVSLAAYHAVPPAIGAQGVFGKLGVGFIMLGLFMCMFVIYMLRLPANLRSKVLADDGKTPTYDGQNWFDFFPIWVFAALFVFTGCYSLLSDIHETPLPEMWWLATIPAITVLVFYVPIWKFFRTI